MKFYYKFIILNVFQEIFLKNFVSQGKKRKYYKSTREAR